MTVSTASNLEQQVNDNKTRLTDFDNAIKDWLNNDAYVIVEGRKAQPFDWSDHPFDDDLDFINEFQVVSNKEKKEADEEFKPDTVDDRYLNMELALPKGDDLNPQLAKVMKRLRDANGIPIGMANDNPILDSRVYEVKYQDGTKA